MKDKLEVNKDEYTIEDIMDLFRVSHITAQRWLTKGDLKGEKINVGGVRKWIIPKKEVLNYIKEKNA